MSSADTPKDSSTALRADIRHLGRAARRARSSARRGRSSSTWSRRSARLTRSDPARPPPPLLGEVDLATAARLVRAFSTYFHLANVTEQVHRGRELRDRRAADGRLAGAGRRPRSTAARSRRTASSPRRRPARRAPGLHRAPDRGGPPHDADQAAPDRGAARGRGRAAGPGRRPAPGRPRLAEVIDLLWQTDELRVGRPEPVDEARNAVYYLDELHAATRSPTCSRSWPTSWPRLGVELPRDGPAAVLRHLDRRRPRRQPERHPEVTLRRPRCCSTSTRIRDALDAGRRAARGAVVLDPAGRRERRAAGLARPPTSRRCPRSSPRYLRLNAEEPYRLKATCVRQKLAQHPRAARRRRPAHAGPRLPRHRRSCSPTSC